jgi:hypothetical protein
MLLTVVLASCNTFRIAGAPTFDRVHEISVADIEAAVAAYKSAHIYEDTSVGQKKCMRVGGRFAESNHQSRPT